MKEYQLSIVWSSTVLFLVKHLSQLGLAKVDLQTHIYRSLPVWDYKETRLITMVHIVFCDFLGSEIKPFIHRAISVLKWKL